MRWTSKLFLVLGVAALLAGPALAQQPRQGRGQGGFGLMGLLQMKEVQDDLTLKAEQTTKLKEAGDKFREDNREQMQKAFNRDTPQEERAEIMKKLTEGSNKIVTDTLQPEQMKRLKQIELQGRLIGRVGGFGGGFGGGGGGRGGVGTTGVVGVLSDAEMQKTLKLSDQQKEDIETLGKDLAKKRADLFQGGFNQENFRKIQEMTRETNENAMKVLSDEQKKTLNEMKGKEFKFPEIRRPGGQGGQPGQRVDF